jgi:hypothetical protein
MDGAYWSLVNGLSPGGADVRIGLKQCAICPGHCRNRHHWKRCSAPKHGTSEAQRQPQFRSPGSKRARGNPRAVKFVLISILEPPLHAGRNADNRRAGEAIRS